MRAIGRVAIVPAAIAALGLAFSSCEKSGSDGGRRPTTQPVGNLVVLKLDLPRRQFIGTKEAIRAGHFPRSGPKPDEPLKIPRGLTNLAKGRAVTASDDLPSIGELEYITDGDKEAQAGSFVELGPGKQHVQIDLGGPCEIFAIVVWHDHHIPQVYRDVVVQVSSDEHLIENKTVFNNDHDNSSGLGLGKDYEWIETHRGKIIPVAGLKGRYVRLYSNGCTLGDDNIYTEVEIYGRAVTAGKSS